MGRVCVLLALLPVAVAAVPVQTAEGADPPQQLKLGMPKSMFNGVPEFLIQHGSQPFKAMLEKQTGLKGDVLVIDDYADTTAKLRAGKLDVAVYHGFEYAWVKQHPELIPLMVAVPNNKLQACLVVNVKSNAGNPAQLKGACVAVPNGTKAHCHLYFERLKEKQPVGCLGVAKLAGTSVEDALDAVADGTCEAALVDVAALDAYRVSKPGVGATLKVLDKSAHFPSAIIVYRKDAFNEKDVANIRAGLIKSMNAQEGKRLRELWKLEGFSDIGKEYKTELDSSLKTYPAPNQKTQPEPKK